MFKKYIYIKSEIGKSSSKKTLAIFLIGLIFGVYLSKFTFVNPSQILQTPVNLSMAQTKNLVLPIAEGDVLSAMDESVVIPGGFEKIIAEPEPSTKAAEIAVIEPIATTTAAPVATQTPKTGSLTIAFLGDSMVDTMGANLPYINSELKKTYPNFQFDLLNYGTGGTNIEYGIQKLTNDYQYLGKNIPALVKSSPDITVVESFAYNPWSGEQSDLDRHWLDLAKIADILKSQTKSKIIFMSTIAPNKANFGVGPNGVNWDKNTAYQHAQIIEKYLDNTIRFASSQGYPVVDAYHPSQNNNDGIREYINANDGIHPSVAGCQLIARLVVQKLTGLGWIR